MGPTLGPAFTFCKSDCLFWCSYNALLPHRPEVKCPHAICCAMYLALSCAMYCAMYIHLLRTVSCPVLFTVPCTVPCAALCSSMYCHVLCLVLRRVLCHKMRCVVPCTAQCIAMCRYNALHPLSRVLRSHLATATKLLRCVPLCHRRCRKAVERREARTGDPWQLHFLRFHQTSTVTLPQRSHLQTIACGEGYRGSVTATCTTGATFTTTDSCALVRISDVM
jgi:hypothetical protein